jgi:outer membrane protein assembly factor BamE (lipoprotein component of BamABCDE complex)
MRKFVRNIDFTLVFVICSIIFCSIFYFKGKVSGEKFDSNLWKTADLNTENNMSLRWDMMNSLRGNHNLIGKNKTEIINLLGRPSDVTNDFYYYYLGYSGTGINTGSLRISFDSKGKVSEIFVWQG